VSHWILLQLSNTSSVAGLARRCLDGVGGGDHNGRSLLPSSLPHASFVHDKTEYLCGAPVCPPRPRPSGRRTPPTPTGTRRRAPPRPPSSRLLATTQVGNAALAVAVYRCPHRTTRRGVLKPETNSGLYQTTREGAGRASRKEVDLLGFP
jgi:hypothetical protein